MGRVLQAVSEGGSAPDAASHYPILPCLCAAVLTLQLSAWVPDRAFCLAAARKPGPKPAVPCSPTLLQTPSAWSNTAPTR